MAYPSLTDLTFELSSQERKQTDIGIQELAIHICISGATDVQPLVLQRESGTQWICDKTIKLIGDFVVIASLGDDEFGQVHVLRDDIEHAWVLEAKESFQYSFVPEGDAQDIIMTLRCSRSGPRPEGKSIWEALIASSPKEQVEIISHLVGNTPPEERSKILLRVVDRCFELFKTDPTSLKPLDIAVLVCNYSIDFFQHPHLLALFHTFKGILHYTRYCTGSKDLTDLDEAISSFEIQDATPCCSDHGRIGLLIDVLTEEPGLPPWFDPVEIHYMHAFCLSIRQTFVHQPDLDRAFQLTEILLSRVPKTHPPSDRFTRLKSDLLCTHSRYTWDDTDLAQYAISQAKTASRHSTNLDLMQYIQCCSARYRISSNINYIHEAISACQQGLTARSAPENAPENVLVQPIISLSYAHFLSLRFMVTGDPDDLSQSIEELERGLECENLDHLNFHPFQFQSAIYGALGLSLTLQYKYSAGNQCLKCSGRTGDLTYLDKAIEATQMAVAMWEGMPLDRGFLLRQLSDALHDRYKCTGEESNLSEAILIQQDLVGHTPDGDIHKSLFRLTLGDLYRDSESSSKGVIDPGWYLAEALSQYELAANPTCRVLDPVPLRAAYRRAAILGTISKIPNCQTLMQESFEAYGQAMDLLSEWIGIGRTIQERQRRLVEFSQLASNAVTSAICHGQNERAVEWLEQGRCLVWNQINNLRTPMEDLLNYRQDLGNRAAQIAKFLDQCGSHKWETCDLDILPGDTTMEAGVSEQLESAEEWDNILCEVRSIPQFHDFLRPPTCATILDGIPRDGVVVIINVETLGSSCDALALIGGADSPLHIPLDGFSHTKAKHLSYDLSIHRRNHRAGSSNPPATPNAMHRAIPLAQRLEGLATCGEDIDRGSRSKTRSGIKDILRILWTDLVEPILDGLAISNPTSDPLRIWWCPTGELAFLPIHAAGIYATDGQPAGPCLSDFVVSSYIPSVSTLIERVKRPHRMDSNSRLLAISQPNTPGQTSIPFTTAEVVQIENRLKMENVQCTSLEGKVAVRDRVGKEIQSHSCIHLACHASQNAEQPWDSGFYLEDGMLQISDIIKENLPNADLAFLSACETSTGNRNLSDEAVHLAGGMLAAGYRSVVGTTWTIQDAYGPTVAKHFYEHLLESAGGVLDGAGAARALHFAIKRLRSELGDSDKDFMTWLPYVHLGY